MQGIEGRNIEYGVTVTLCFRRKLHVVAEVFAEVEVWVGRSGKLCVFKAHFGKRENAIAFVDESQSIILEVLCQVAVGWP